MRLFLPGAYWHTNRGDAALVDGFLRLLRERWPDAEAILTSFRPADDKDVFDARVIPMLVRPDSVAQRLMSKAVHVAPVFAPLQSVVHLISLGIVICYLRAWAWLLKRSVRLAQVLSWQSLWINAQAIRQADRLIAVPGGYLNAYRWTNTFWLYHVPVIFLASYLGKPLSLAPCTIGPFAGINRPIARLVLSFTDQIFLREELSKEMLRDLAVPLRRTPVVTFDVAFVFADESSRELESSGCLRTLGVSVRDHNFPGSSSIAASRQRYLEACASAIQDLLDHDTTALVAITAQTLEDEAISFRLKALLASPRVSVRVDLASPTQLLRHYEGMRLVLGTRMHANILAMCVSTPVVAIGYDPKTRGVMRSLGLEDRVLDIDDLSLLSAQLIRSWDEAPNDRQLVGEKVTYARGELSALIKSM